MVSAQIAAGWRMDVDRGPDWMFVRLHPAQNSEIDDFSLAEQIWSVMEQSFTYRLVLELDQVAVLQSGLIAQLVLLSKRIHTHSGMLRLCGLSPGKPTDSALFAAWKVACRTTTTGATR